MKYKVKFTKQFKKDVKLAKKQNKNLDKLYEVVELLAKGENLIRNTEITHLLESTKVLENVISNQTGC
ncbi:MAG: hypothetical protein BWX74_00565 [Tenericutes bacterium ADurb.Bin087]|nr:MAG: hypothetical protein BWX74_00565 [Tenericutes bacterium ADurb.Bin087]